MNADPLALRADAVRNRAAILAAAERLFAERGFDVPLATLAAEAGVGRTTLHRNFATREHIAFALFEVSVEELRAAAESGAGFHALFDRLLDCFVRNGGIAEAIQAYAHCQRLLELRQETIALLRPALDRAVAEGALRPDFSEADLRMVYEMAVGALLTGGTPADRRAKADRLRALVFQGIGLAKA